MDISESMELNMEIGRISILKLYSSTNQLFFIILKIAALQNV